MRGKMPRYILTTKTLHSTDLLPFVSSPIFPDLSHYYYFSKTLRRFTCHQQRRITMNQKSKFCSKIKCCKWLYFEQDHTY